MQSVPQQMSVVFEPLRVQPDLSPSLIGHPLPGASRRPSRLMFFLSGLHTLGATAKAGFGAASALGSRRYR